MKVREIRLNNFKRFTDTTIGEIPREVRLVVVVGPNGCGKSSVIDAALTWHGHRWARRGGWDATYHLKQAPGAAGQWNQNVDVSFHDPQPIDEHQGRKAIYVRTAYRNDPEFQLGQLSRVPPAVQESRFNRLIDNDQAVSQNYQRLVAEGFEYAYESGDPTETLAFFRERSIGAIRDSMQRLFPGLVLNGLGNPLTEGTFRFDKGESKAFLYKNLSGGEKAAFDLLLDILVKRREFDDTVFFIDEPETHMSTALQAALLDEIFNLVPQQSQLWIATHSIGMMRKARELSRRFAGEVAFLDFDGINFDVRASVTPTGPDRPFWKRAMQIALDDMAGYIAPEYVVLCEGGTVAGGSDFDASCYNTIFASDYPEVVFLGAGSADDVQNDPRRVEGTMKGIAPSVQVIRLIDRDDRTDNEMLALRARGIRVLTLRTIESYLLDDSVLTAVCHQLGDGGRAQELLDAKQRAMTDSVAAGGPPDDLKRTAGDIYNAAKQLFPNIRLGSNNRAFMAGVCAPLVRAQSVLYGQMRSDVFGT
jgi:RecF/RecN/SMC N terminal domain